MNKKVNLFIVGAARAGTTSLWQYLKKHAQVYMPEDELYKEPCFFSSYGEGMGMDNYLSIFSQASPKHKIIGEASTAYLTDPSSAKRIYDYNRDAKIIIMLRNPAERAYSLYNWMVQDGYEYSPTFEAALDLENARSQKNIPNWFEPQYYWNYMYFRSGLYCDQVRRYLELFGSNVMIIKFEHFRQDTVAVYNKVCSFLNIEPHTIKPLVHNPSRGVFSPKIQFMLRKLVTAFHDSGRELLMSGETWRIKDLYYDYEKKLSSVTRFTLVDKVTGAYVLHRVNPFLKGASRLTEVTETKEYRDQLLQFGLTRKNPPKLSHNTRATLKAEYCSDIERLSAFTNIDFLDWLVA